MKSSYRIPSGIGLRKYAYDIQQQQAQTPQQPGFNEYLDNYMNMHKQRMMYNMMDRAFYHNLPQQQGHINTQPQPQQPQQPQQVQHPQQQQPQQQTQGNNGGWNELSIGINPNRLKGGIGRMAEHAGNSIGSYLDKISDIAKGNDFGQQRTKPMSGAVY